MNSAKCVAAAAQTEILPQTAVKPKSLVDYIQAIYFLSRNIQRFILCTAKADPNNVTVLQFSHSSANFNPRTMVALRCNFPCFVPFTQQRKRLERTSFSSTLHHTSKKPVGIKQGMILFNILIIHPLPSFH